MGLTPGLREDQPVVDPRRGQAAADAALLLVAIVAALIFMGVYLQRGAQGGVKASADSFGTQFSATQTWTNATTSVIQAGFDGNVTHETVEQDSHFSQTLTGP